MQRLVLLLCFLFAGVSVYSQSGINAGSVAPACQLSHVMGGDMSVRHDSGNYYTLTVMVYRDTTQFLLPSGCQIYVYTFDSGAAKYMYDSTTLIPMDSSLFTSLYTMRAFGTEVGYYTMHTQLPKGRFQFVYQSCCRNPLITNTLNATTENQVFHTEIEIADNGNNSTPRAMLTPVSYFPLNKNAALNPLPYIADADSYVCNLVSPLGTFISNNATSGFASMVGFSAPPASPSGSFSMNPVTGEITWTPNSQGNFVESFQIKEYKAGQLVGSMIRDMEFLIVASGGADSLYFSAQSACQVSPAPSYNYLIYTAGQPINFQISGGSSDTAENISLNAYGEIFDGTNQATFTTTGAVNSMSGTLTWTPPVGYTKNVIVVFRLKGAMFSKDYTLMLRSSAPSDPSGVNGVSLENDDLSVYPVPAVNTLNVSSHAGKKYDLSVINTLGRKIWSGRLENEVKINVQEWPKGVYYMQFTGQGNMPVMRKIIVD